MYIFYIQRPQSKHGSAESLEEKHGNDTQWNY